MISTGRAVPVVSNRSSRSIVRPPCSVQAVATRGRSTVQRFKSSRPIVDVVVAAGEDVDVVEKDRVRRPCWKLPRFSQFRKRGINNSYFARPRRRRSSPAGTAPSLLIRALDLAMILRNLPLVLRARVSSSALRIGITAANGFPRLKTMIGFFLAFVAYSRKGRDAFLKSTFVIT